MSARKENWQGMNWCRPATRLAIYLRDGMACTYCGRGLLKRRGKVSAVLAAA